jgi:peptidoglycan/LPS O-acetylase OafA/YrhL
LKITENLAVSQQTISPVASVRGYRPELDAVRFLAFLFVFFAHEIPHDPSPTSFTNHLSPGGARIVFGIANMCTMGLCLFFALSAYLITNLLLKERDENMAVSVRKFYLRRILRIWPLYIFGILIGIAWAFAFLGGQHATGFAWYMLFAGNFYCASVGWFNNPMLPLWTISIEEQFYLIWPWAMRWFSRRDLVLCALVFILVANIKLFNFGQRHANTDYEVWCNAFVQFEMFAVGILLALARSHRKPGNVVAGVMLAISGPVLWFVACYTFQVKQAASMGLAISGFAMIVGYALIAVGCGAILQGFCMIGSSHIPKWAANLGKISYGLYVYHFLAIRLSFIPLLLLHIPYNVITSCALAFPLTILAAKLSYTHLESPFLRLKRRFEIVHSRPI